MRISDTEPLSVHINSIVSLQIYEFCIRYFVSVCDNNMISRWNISVLLYLKCNNQCISGRPDSHWLRHFQIILWNRWTEFNKTWQEARTQRIKLKMSQSIRGGAAILFFRPAWKKQTKWGDDIEILLLVKVRFPIDPINANLVEDVEILFPVKFCGIPFSGFRGNVAHFPTNQRPGPQSCCSDQPEKHQLRC